MSNFEFKYTAIDGSVTTRTFDKNFLPEVLEEFELFLRGCGFYFDGTLDFIDEKEEQSIGLGPNHPIIHSQHYYDFDRNR